MLKTKRGHFFVEQCLKAVGLEGGELQSRDQYLAGFHQFDLGKGWRSYFYDDVGFVYLFGIVNNSGTLLAIILI